MINEIVFQEVTRLLQEVKGAVKEGADIFLVPSKDNYEEAIKIKKD